MGHRYKGPKRDTEYPPQLILLQEPCHVCGKTSYTSKQSAKSHVKHLDRANKKHHVDSRVTPYRCPHGNGWHLAHVHPQGQRTGVVPRPAKVAELWPQLTGSAS